MQAGIAEPQEDERTEREGDVSDTREGERRVAQDGAAVAHRPGASQQVEHLAECDQGRHDGDGCEYGASEPEHEEEERESDCRAGDAEAQLAPRGGAHQSSSGRAPNRRRRRLYSLSARSTSTSSKSGQ